MATLAVELSPTDTLALGRVETSNLQALEHYIKHGDQSPVTKEDIPAFDRLTPTCSRAAQIISEKSERCVLTAGFWLFAAILCWISLMAASVENVAFWAIVLAATSFYLWRIGKPLMTARAVRRECYKIVRHELARRRADIPAS